MFYINEKTRVLQKVSSGKLNKSTNTIENQSGQKEGTCWYYAAKGNVRYGKFFTGPERAIEKIISNYRKKCTEITKSYTKNRTLAIFLEKWTKNHFVPGESEKDAVKRLLKTVSGSAALSTLIAFASSTSETFYEFIEDEQGESIIQACREFSKELNFDIEQAKKDLLESQGLSDEYDDDLNTLSSYYDNVFIKHLWAKLGYSKSQWHPAKGVQSLIDELHQYTCLFEITVHKIIPSAIKPELLFATYNHPGYLIQEIIQSNDFPPEQHSHIIRVIGADLENVFYLDPVDASEQDQPRKVNKMAYSLFCQVLLNGQGNRVDLKCDTTKAPSISYHINHTEEYAFNNIPLPTDRKRLLEIGSNNNNEPLESETISEGKQEIPTSVNFNDSSLFNLKKVKHEEKDPQEKPSSTP